MPPFSLVFAANYARVRAVGIPGCLGKHRSLGKCSWRRRIAADPPCSAANGGWSGGFPAMVFKAPSLQTSVPQQCEYYPLSVQGPGLPSRLVRRGVRLKRRLSSADSCSRQLPPLCTCRATMRGSQ